MSSDNIDKLNVMFQLQEKLMERYAKRDPNFPSWPINHSKHSQKFVRDVLVNSAAEIFESTRELKNSKQHRETIIDDFDRSAFIEECCDALKFLFEALIMCGVNTNELFDAFVKKDTVCHKRLNEKY